MYKKTGKYAAAALVMLCFGVRLGAQSLSASLDNSSMWLGQSTKLTLVLEDSDQEISPGLSIPGIAVTPLGGSPQNSQTITTINGKTTRQVSYKYIYAYQLTPERAGTFTIPSINVDVGGTRLSTRALSLTVKQPQKNDDYHMLLKADRTKAYPGQEITLTVTLLFSKSIRSLYFEIPALKNVDFYGVAPKGGNSGNAYQIQINGTTVPFARVDREYNGKNYAGVSGVLKLQSTKTGKVSLANPSAVFEGSVGTQRVRDFFGRVTEQDVYDTIVIPADPLSFSILPYPQEGKPEGFFGLAGNVRMKVSANPRQVRVGDPITLELAFSGVDDPYVVFPPLKQYLGEDFKIPADRSPDAIDGKTKTVTQTIRAVSEQTSGIPALRIPYFNTEKGEYGYLESDPLPLTVEASATVGIEDLEGDTGGSGKVSTEKLKEGMYFNYGGPDLLVTSKPLVPAVLSSPWFWLALLLPPLAAAGLFVFYTLFPQIRQKQLERRTARQELKAIEKKMHGKGAAGEDGEQLINAFLSNHFGIRHYSQLGNVISMTEREKDMLNAVMHSKYRRNTDDAEHTGTAKNMDDGPLAILSILREKI